MGEPADYTDVDLLGEAYWEGDEEEEPYLGCALCSHDMVNECGIGEFDYFVTGEHICVCCSDDDARASTPDRDRGQDDG